MDALQYEHLIRRAFQCGRYGVPGADADTFRGLETSFVNSRDNTDAARHDQLLFKYAFDCGEVAAYVGVAVNKFAKDFELELNDTEKQEIEDVLGLLDEATIDEIEQAGERAEILMVAHGRFP